jgi:hypothetical protein
VALLKLYVYQGRLTFILLAQNKSNKRAATIETFFTPDKLIAQTTALATFAFACSVVTYPQAKKVHTIAAPPAAPLLSLLNKSFNNFSC